MSSDTRTRAIEATPVDPRCDSCGQSKSQHSMISDSGHKHGPYCPDPRSMQYLGETTFRRRPADMPRDGLAPHPDVPLGLYRHTKSGGLYEVTGGAFLATGEGDTVLVVYQSVGQHYVANPNKWGDDYQCVRTVADFMEEVEDGKGERVRRFVYLGPNGRNPR